MKEEIRTEAGERLDDLGRGGYRIIQKKDLFCFGIDAVLLSSYAAVRPGEKTLDLGCGNGILPLLLRAKTKGRDFTGLEINEESARLAKRSVELNHLEDEIRILTGDIRQIRDYFSSGTFEVVVSNPPYMTADDGKKSDTALVAAARHELLCTFEDIAAAASFALKMNGRLYLVHRPWRLAQIIHILCAHHLEPKRIRLVHPFADREPNLVLIEARKGARPEVRIEAPLVVYKEKGIYTDEVLEMYGMSGGQASGQRS